MKVKVTGKGNYRHLKSLSQLSDLPGEIKHAKYIKVNFKWLVIGNKELLNTGQEI